MRMLHLAARFSLAGGVESHLRRLAAARETARAHSWEAETRKLLGAYERTLAEHHARLRK